jgi:hypothetical protein
MLLISLSRITPAMKSNAAIAMNIRVRKVMVVWFAKKFTSARFNMTRSRTQVNMRLAMIKNPPMAMLNLASFRICPLACRLVLHIVSVFSI